MNIEKSAYKILLISQNTEDRTRLQNHLDAIKVATIHLDQETLFEQARELILEAKYDAYLIDYDILPESALALVQSVYEDCAKPLIIIDEQEQYERDIAAMEAGASYYLPKKHIVPSILERLLRYNIYYSSTRDELQNFLEIQNTISGNLLETASQLKVAKDELQQKNTEMLASHRKLEDLNQTNQQFLNIALKLYKNHFIPLRENIENMLNSVVLDTKEGIRQAAREIHQMDELLRPVTLLGTEQAAIHKKRVLLAELDRKQQIVAKMALGGTGIDFDIVADFTEGEERLKTSRYDILCVDLGFIELARMAHEQYPETQIVFMTSANAPAYLPIIIKLPFLSNIVSRDKEDRTFTLKNILVTISKLLTDDLFGLEKYMSWGVEVHQMVIRSSRERAEMVENMERILDQFGVHRSVIRKAGMVAEELLMNAIYDAPHSADGKPLYNHLSRINPVELPLNEQGIFRFACDGMLLALSVQDPFGALGRHTILNYLQKSYLNRNLAEDSQEKMNKGGAGLGLFQIMSASDLFVINVKPGVRTEVIVVFNIDPDKPKNTPSTSFQYFCH
ncbi:MAG: hypothetical protein HQM12_19250 [SAR324 cluster bacterium]|nr:hypothetical protein [SAR324 cluster bacterium]